MAGVQVGLKQLVGLTPQRWEKLTRRSPRLTAIDHPGLTRHLETFRGPAPCVVLPPEDECDLYYSAHVWVSGETLDVLGGQVRPDVALGWTHQLAAALDFLHRLPDGPIAHRDLHPGNIVIMPSGNAVIIDYETALPFEGVSDGTTLLMGRVGFIPPERATDRTASADAGDRWQLGMLTVHALLGHPQGAMTSRQLYERLRDRLEGYVPHPESTSQAIMAMIEVRPSDRPGSCTEWAATLALPPAGGGTPVIREVPAGARPPEPSGPPSARVPPPARRDKPVLRRRGLVGAAVSLVAVVALVWAIAGGPDPGPRQATDIGAQSSEGLRLISLASSGAEPSLITAAPDGTLWFTQQRDDSIWKLKPGSEPVRVLSLPPGSRPFGITAAPDGSIWYTEGEADGSSGDAVGKLNPDGTPAHRTTFPMGSEPTGIIVAPDGRVWITAYGAKAVYWISADGSQTGGPFPMKGNPNRIIMGPDNHIWVTIATRPDVVVLAQDGTVVREYLVVPGPTDIVVAPDRKLWITSFNSNSVQWIDPATGQVSEPVEIRGGPGALVVGPDGNLWVTQLAGRAVTALSLAGDVVRTVPIAGGTPFGIAAGPDQAVWFTVHGVTGTSPDAIGRIAVRR